MAESFAQRDWAVAPGELLVEALEERGMSQSELARRMGRPTKTINEIANGKAAITPETAIQLEFALGITAAFWNRLEAQYREDLARQRAREAHASQIAWARRFPIRDLVRRQLIDDPKDDAEQVASVLRYFQVASPEAWRSQWAASPAWHRSSPSFEARPESVSVWLRLGELLAEQVEVGPYDQQAFHKALRDIRVVTRRAPASAAVEAARRLCAEAGVTVVLAPEFPGTTLSGAARWLSPGRPVIQLSLRHKRDDHLWFTLFHEAGHITRGKKRDFIDDVGVGIDDPEEAAADAFARDTLIPAKPFRGFVEEGDFSAVAVRAFAKRIEIAPGVVVGRLQHDDLIGARQLNDLKRPVQWAGR
jgi:addiction module HigA family antidote